MTRRLAMLLIVLVVVAVAAAAVAWVALRDADEVPTTRQALAAVTVEVLDIEPTSYDLDPSHEGLSPIGAQITWEPEDEAGPQFLQIDVVRDLTADELEACESYQDCDSWDGPEGRYYLVWQEATPEEDPGLVRLTYLVDGEARSVEYAGTGIRGDPRDQALPRSVEDFEELLADDRFSTTTTEEMVDVDLPRWPD